MLIYFHLDVTAYFLLQCISMKIPNEHSKKGSGEKMWKIAYPKYKGGDGVVQEVKEQCTYGEKYLTSALIHPVEEKH